MKDLISCGRESEPFGVIELECLKHCPRSLVITIYILDPVEVAQWNLRDHLSVPR